MQVRVEPIKETVQRLQAALAFLGESSVKPRRDGTQIICRFDSEFPPSIRLRLKVEANTQKPNLDIEALLHSYREYMNFSVEKPPTQREYILNMEAKMKDAEFLGDTTALLRPDVPYNPQEAYDLVRTQMIERI